MHMMVLYIRMFKILFAVLAQQSSPSLCLSTRVHWGLGRHPSRLQSHKGIRTQISPTQKDAMALCDPTQFRGLTMPDSRRYLYRH
jgi:hypothetical protein